MSKTDQRICGYSFVREGIRDDRLGYDGSVKFLRCSRCKDVHYKDRESQRRGWKRHKLSCRILSDSEIDALSKIPTLGQCKKELEKSLINPNGGPELSHIIRRIRSLMDAGGKDVGSMGMELHTLCRSLIFIPQNLMLTAMSRPGMAELMLTDNIEQLFSIKMNLVREIDDYNGRPTDDYIEVGITDEVERKRVRGICDKIDRYDLKVHTEPSSMSFCYLYFNLLVAAAIQGEASPSSVHDGNGRIRGSDGSAEYLLATAALRRALSLWSEPNVLSSCGDAMAPAASLVLTAVSHYADGGNNLFGSNCRDNEIVPGLTVDGAVLACLAELQESAGSGSYSVQLTKHFAALASLKSSQQPNNSEEKQPFWSDLPVNRRAKVAMRIVHYIFEYDTESNNVASMEDCDTLFKTVCGMANPENEVLAKSVFEAASTAEERCGPAEAGLNDEVRAFFFFQIRRDGSLCGITDAMDRVKKFYNIQDVRFLPKNNILGKEKNRCLRLAMGNARHNDYRDKFCQNPNCPKARAERCKTMHCSLCGRVRFCDRECFVASWPSHKKECKKIQKKKTRQGDEKISERYGMHRLEKASI